jgi:hypothetical protein
VLDGLLLLALLLLEDALRLLQDLPLLLLFWCHELDSQRVSGFVDERQALGEKLEVVAHENKVVFVCRHEAHSLKHLVHLAFERENCALNFSDRFRDGPLLGLLRVFDDVVHKSADQL